MGLLKFLIISLTSRIALKSLARLNLSGIGDGSSDHVRVVPNVPFSIELFGKNLSSSGFYFTTSSRCEDYNRTDLGEQDTVFIDSVDSFGRYAYFEVKGGLSFKHENKMYHLCHLNSSFSSFKYLQVYAKLPEFENNWTKYAICVYCVLMAAYGSGMTIGFMKFSIADLNRMLNSDEPVRTRARRILRFRKKSNWLVCTFSMFSTIHSVIFTTQIEDFFSNTSYGKTLSIAVPTVILFVFAEFIPQALCNSKFGFVLASGLWPITVIIFIVCSPIAWPASRIIDWFLGRDVREVMTEEEKLNMVRNVAKKRDMKERNIMEKATTFSSKTVIDVMTPIDKVFLLPSSQKLNKCAILTLVEKGFTRIPVRDEKNRENIYAVLNVKELISYDLSNSPTVAKIVSRTDKKSGKMKYVICDMKVQQLMQQMRTGGFHIATVIRFIHSAYKVIGIITIEDILGQIFGEIEKEADKTATFRAPAYNENIVISWCREAGTDEKYPLSFSQQVLVIQYLLEECPSLHKLGVDVVEARQILTTNRIRKGGKGENLFSKDMLVIVFEGLLEVKRENEPITQEILVKRIDDKLKSGDNSIQAFVAGKGMMKQVLHELQLSADPSLVEETITEVICRSEQCKYFKIRVQDIIDVINEADTSIMKTDRTNIYEMYSTGDFPIVRPPPSRTPSPSVSLSSESGRSDGIPESVRLLTPKVSTTDIMKRLNKRNHI